MTDLLKQLSELVLGSVPTMVLFVCTLMAYRLLVHTPLTKVLAERHQRTQGAIDQATAAIAAVQDKMTEYEQRLSTARAAIFHAREDRLRILQAESEKALMAARLTAQERVLVERDELDRNFEAAQMEISTSIEQLGAQAIARVLPRPTISVAVATNIAATKVEAPQ